MRACCFAVKAVVVVLAAVGVAANLSAAAPAIVVSPPPAELAGNFARAQLLVAKAANGSEAAARNDDQTGRGTCQASDSAVVAVAQAGGLLAESNGGAVVPVAVDGEQVGVPV